MFGKKKSAEVGEATPKAAKTKAAKPSKKNSTKKGPSTNFFVAHAEKFVLGLGVLALGYLVYGGLAGKGYDPKREPKALGDMASKLMTDISNNDPWPMLAEERAIKHDFAKRTEEARQPSDPSLYPLPVMEIQDKGAYEKRGDPELLAPIKVIGQSVVGIIAVEADEKALDPFEEFEDAEKLEGSRKPSRDRGRGPNNAASGYGAGYGAEAAGGEAGSSSAAGMPMGGYGGMGQGNGTQRLFPSLYNKGFSIGGVGGAGSMGGYGMEAGGTSMPGYGSTMGSAAGGVGGGGSVLAGGPVVKEKKTLPKAIFFNAVTALVPHEEMIKEYNAKLRESASFLPDRDRPIYLSFEVQRVEVGDDPTQPINEANWKTVTDASKQLAMMKNWLPKYPQQVPDVIDPSAAELALTMPIPPFLIKDYRSFVKHPDIDWAWDAGMSRMQMPADVAAPVTPEIDEGRLPGEQVAAGGAMGGYGMGMGMGMGSGMPGYGGGESAGYGSEMGGYGSAMGGMGGSSSMPGYGGGESAGYGMETGGMGGYGSAMGGMGGMGGYGASGYGGMGAATRPAPYKMVRFYDPLSAKDVKKTFRYRIRVMMEDPNYPSDRFQAPRLSDLKDEVFARVAKLKEKEDHQAEQVRKENLNARPNTPKKVFNRTKRYTAWSEASNPIFVRATEDIYVGGFAAKKGSEPVAEAVIVTLDTRGPAYVPMYAFMTKDSKGKDAVPVCRRGAVLTMEKINAQFAHPVTTVIKEWPEYDGFGSKAPFFNVMAPTVVDIRGNEELTLSDRQNDPLSDIGEMMVLMGDQRVEVTNEFDDTFWYRGFTLADEREAAESAGPSSTDASAAPGPAGTGSR